MANEIFKELKTKIALKQNTYEYWINGEGKDYIPLYGEVCFCEIPSPNAENPNNGSSEATNPPTVLFKVGTAKRDENGDWVTGTAKKFSELKWVSALAADVYDWAKAATKPTYAAAEITGIGDYIAEYVNDQMGITTDTNTVYRIVKVDELTYKLQKKAANEADTAWADVDGSVIAIPESTKVEASEKNGYIKVDDEDVIVYDEIFGVDMATVNALGGIAAGTNLKDKTIHEVLNALLFPYVAPVVAQPSRTPSTTAALEKGNDQTVTSVTAKVTKKSEPIVKVELIKGESEVIATKEGDELPNITTSGTNVTFSNLSVSIPSSSVTFKVRATDATGKSTTSSASAGWTFVYPYFYGICAGDKTAATLTEADIEAMTKDIKSRGEKSYEYKNMDNQKMVIAYPKTYGALKKALDPNNFDYIEAYDRAELNITGLDGSAQTYYVYAQKEPTYGTTTMKYQY